MELYDEEQRRKQENLDKKINKIIMRAIIIISITIVILIGIIYYIKNNPNEVTIKIDGRETPSLSSIIEFETKEDGTMMINAPIKQFATFVGYMAYNGEYGRPSEDKSIYSVKNDYEIAEFHLNSSIIYKKNLSIQNSTYEEYKVDANVFEKNGVLYTDLNGLKCAFNLYIQYNKETKTLNIYTLKRMIEFAKNRAVKNFAKAGIDAEKFTNTQAILDGKIVVTVEKKTETGTTYKYGVIDYSTGKDILSSKYDEITYIPSNKTFIAKINGKYGIYREDKDDEEIEYEELKLLDNNKKLYLAKKDGLYGIIDINENVIINFEYDEIGINKANFEQNKISSEYILLNELIPARKSGKWGFLGQDGKTKVQFDYDGIGCIISNNSTNANNRYSVIEISEYGLIVVKKDGMYTLINKDGKEIMENILTSVYIKKTSGNNEYYIERDRKEYNVIDVLKQLYK